MHAWGRGRTEKKEEEWTNGKSQAGDNDGAN